VLKEAPRYTVGALAGLAVAVGAVYAGPRVAPTAAVFVGLLGLAFVGFAAGAWCVLRLPVRAAVLLIVTGALATQAAAWFGPPRSSDDLYRYIWDGRVQAAGIDPYRYAPAASELVGLRDAFLWPAQAAWCVGPDTVDTGAPLTPGCTRINRPEVHTIYPPVAEALFAVVYGLSPPGTGYAPITLAAALAALGVTVLLLRGRNPRRAVLWAWCPAVGIEAASNAHVDVVAVLLTVAALGLLTRPAGAKRAAVGGVLLGLAVATKLTPALVLPGVLRRRPVLVLAAAAGAVVTVYLPHVLAVGAGVLGYLPGYLQEEGYDTGQRFALLTLVLPASWAAAAAVVILAAVAFWAWRRDDPVRAAAVLTGTALLVTTPPYPWYGLLLVALVASGAPAVWLVVVVAGYVGQYQHELHLATATALRLGYGAAALILLAGMAAGRGAGHRLPWRHDRCDLLPDRERPERGVRPDPPGHPEPAGGAAR
jgi:hypothetical protein